MRWTSGLAAAWVIVAASVATAHPPGGVPRPESEGRVPLYPDGDRYREADLAQAVPMPPTKPQPAKPTHESISWPRLREHIEALQRHFEMDLLLPPVHL